MPGNKARVTSGQLGPKSKPGTGRKKPFPKPPPINEPPGELPVAEDTPATPATSGQVGPKSSKGNRLRQDSKQARHSDRLRHEDEAPCPVTEPQTHPKIKK